MEQEHFDLFWTKYPNKKAKGAAKKAWDKVFDKLEEEDADKLYNSIMIALDLQKRYRSKAKDYGHFIPPWKYPATWLNQTCWEDEIESFSELERTGDIRLCSECEERAAIANDSVRLCAYHWTRKYGGLLWDELKNKYNECAIGRQNGETKMQWHQRLRELRSQFASQISARSGSGSSGKCQD